MKKDSCVSAVIDSEAVAWDEENQQILPFQILSTRKRKVSGKLLENLWLNASGLIYKLISEMQRDTKTFQAYTCVETKIVVFTRCSARYKAL